MYIYIYIYIYIYTCICVCVYIYIYIHSRTSRPPLPRRAGRHGVRAGRRDQAGFAETTADFHFNVEMKQLRQTRELAETAADFDFDVEMSKL